MCQFTVNIAMISTEITVLFSLDIGPFYLNIVSQRKSKPADTLTLHNDYTLETMTCEKEFARAEDNRNRFKIMFLYVK